MNDLEDVYFAKPLSSYFIMPLFRKYPKVIEKFGKILNQAFALHPVWFWNDWMKSVADAILSFYIS